MFNAKIIILALGIMVLGAGIYWTVLINTSDKPSVPSAEKLQKEEAIFNVSEPPIQVPLTKKPDVEITAEKPVSSAPKPETVPETKTVCSGANFDQFRCYNSYYQGMVVSQGPQKAVEDLKSRYADPFVHSQCHQLTHIIGRAAADIYPAVADAFANGDSFCWSGYFHGVMESIVGKISIGNLGSEMDSICKTLRDKERYSFDHYNCVHGLGHGVMDITENEVFDSLGICDYLGETWERSSCWSGVFMENIIADELNHVSKYLKDDDPLYPCNGVADKYKTTCYLMQTSRMLAIVGYDFKKVFGLCKTVGESYIDTCYQSLGRDASGKTISDVVRTREYCMLGEDARQQSNCIIGAVKDFVSYHHSDVQAKELCGSLTENLRSICFTTSESYYRLF